MDNKKTVYPNPFGWNEIEQCSCKTFYEQRKAEYAESYKEEYPENNALNAFVYNEEAPTPQIAFVDGYKSEKEIGE